MGDPIFDPRYWEKRLQGCHGELHRSIFNGSIDQWNPLEEKARRTVRREIKSHESVLDVGCGWGRLLYLLAEDWRGCYLGIDICPKFIEMAKIFFPNRLFLNCDVRTLEATIRINKLRHYDVAVGIGLKNMIVNHESQEVWEQVEAQIKAVSSRQLYIGLG